MKWGYKLTGSLVLFAMFAIAVNYTPLVWKNTGFVTVHPIVLLDSTWSKDSMTGKGTIASHPTTVYVFGTPAEGNGALLAFQKHWVTGEHRVSLLPLEAYDSK
jgi:hypothetical protein